MNKRELMRKRRDAAYQRLKIEDFDRLIELVNKIRAVTQMDGAMDHLEPGYHTANDCPLYETVTHKASAFGKRWNVDVEDSIRVSRNTTMRVIKERWPEIAEKVTVDDGGHYLEYDHDDGYKVAVDQDPWSKSVRIAFIWYDEVIDKFVGAFDEKKDDNYRFLDETLAEDELVSFLA